MMSSLYKDESSITFESSSPQEVLFSFIQGNIYHIYAEIIYTLIMREYFMY